MSALTEIHGWAVQIADYFGEEWPHTPACQGEAGCPLCLILEESSDGVDDRCIPSRDEVIAAIRLAVDEWYRADESWRGSQSEEVAHAIQELYASRPTVTEVRKQALEDAADAFPGAGFPGTCQGWVMTWLRARAERGEA